MVGRAELITPAMEWKLLKQIVKYSESDTETRQRIVQQTRELGLGRFTEPAVRHLLGANPAHDFNASAWKLVQDLTPQQAKGLARN
jgi:hypothetical protein